MHSKPYLYSSMIYRDMTSDGTTYVALLASYAETLRGTIQAGLGKTPEAADRELRNALASALSRECYPLAIHIVPAYYCLLCRLVLDTRETARAHRQEKHGGPSRSGI